MSAEISRKLVESLESRYAAYVDDLRLLTSIDCQTGYKPGLDEVAGHINSWLREMGASVTTIESRDVGNDVVAVLTGAGAKNVMLLCHTDTVYPLGTVSQRPFRIEGDRAIAPGVCDMKGGLLAAIYALRALDDIGYRDYGSITLLCNSDEEAAPRHSVDLIQNTARQAECVLTMEPARMNGDVVSARKGVLVYSVTARGREAHAGVNPDIGRNAIVALADRILEIWKLNGKSPGLNVNPGLVRGGSAVNTVAGEAVCEIDVRVTRTADIETFDEMLRDILTTSMIPDVTFEATKDHTMPPMEKTNASQRLVDLAQQAAQEIGFELADTFTGGGSDGAYAAQTGVPVLDGLGPIGGFAHSEREFLTLDSVVPRTALLARLITLA